MNENPLVPFIRGDVAGGGGTGGVLHGRADDAAGVTARAINPSIDLVHLHIGAATKWAGL